MKIKEVVEMMRNLIISGKELIKQNEIINTRPVSIF